MWISRRSGCKAIFNELGILHLNLHIIRIVLGTVSRAIVGPQPNCCFSLFLRIGLILERLEPNEF